VQARGNSMRVPTLIASHRSKSKLLTHAKFLDSFCVSMMCAG
jgi:hypothetical protein